MIIYGHWKRTQRVLGPSKGTRRTPKGHSEGSWLLVYVRNTWAIKVLWHLCTRGTLFKRPAKYGLGVELQNMRKWFSEAQSFLGRYI